MRIVSGEVACMRVEWRASIGGFGSEDAGFRVRAAKTIRAFIKKCTG
jgi:hypothetical protein